MTAGGSGVIGGGHVCGDGGDRVVGDVHEDVGHGCGNAVVLRIRRFRNVLWKTGSFNKILRWLE